MLAINGGELLLLAGRSLIMERLVRVTGVTGVTADAPSDELGGAAPRGAPPRVAGVSLRFCLGVLEVRRMPLLSRPIPGVWSHDARTGFRGRSTDAAPLSSPSAEALVSNLTERRRSGFLAEATGGAASSASAAALSSSPS